MRLIIKKTVYDEILKSRGYGIGTVREWKGKKYKKTAPNKWVRVYDSRETQKIYNNSHYGIVEKIKVSDISDKDIFYPEHSFELPKLSERVIKTIKTKNRPVMLKKNIIDKNKLNHKEITNPKESKVILENALYNNDIALLCKPDSKPNYWTVVKSDSDYYLAVIDTDEDKEFIEVVGWRKIDNKRLEKMKEKISTEGGEILITGGDSVDRSAHLSDLHTKRNITPDNNSVNEKNNTFNSIDAVRDFYKGTDKWLKAPNGNDTKLTEKQWCEVRTENFKNWFGDWENDSKKASKIVDENGEPLINYHGTSSDFDEFVKDEIGKTTNNKGIFGNGFYFTNGKKLAENYSKYNKEKQGKVIEGFLNIKKPFIWSEKRNVAVARKLGFPESRIKNGSLLPLNDDKQIMKFTESLKNAGYDGVIFNYKKGTGGRFEEDYVVNETVIFEPNQIKSAENNDGKFDSNSNNINKSFSKVINYWLNKKGA